MKQNSNRRNFLATVGTAALAATTTTLLAAESGGGKTLKILGVSCSARKGMTTAKAVQAALDAAKSANPRIEVELIDLGGLNIAGWSPKPPQDDFAAILPKLQDPAVGGLIIGSPSYFRGLSSLCKAFLESGQRSYNAARILSQHGFRVRNLTGSYRTWRATQPQ